MSIIEINNLSKSYGRKNILNNLSLVANEGEILGLLGPNGAGKTTLIKAIVGLISYDEGTIKINGFDREKEFSKAMANVSAIVENPEMYGYMSGYSNLMQYARIQKITDPALINEVIEIVGLRNRIKDKVKTYSLGMKQRLGIAIALLTRPKVMILDEPTNGLDPMGIKQLRNILRNISRNNNVCIIVSSHLMSEMELMCDKVAIINNKTVTALNTISELKEIVSGDYAHYIYNVEKTKDITSIAASVFADHKKVVDSETITDSAEIIADSETIVDSEIITDSEKDAVSKNTIVSDETTTSDKVPYKLNIVDSTHFEIDVLKDIALIKISDLNKAILDNNIRLFTVAYKENLRLEDAFIKVTTGGGQIA